MAAHFWQIILTNPDDGVILITFPIVSNKPTWQHLVFSSSVISLLSENVENQVSKINKAEVAKYIFLKQRSFYSKQDSSG